MLSKRIIACLDVRDGSVVKGINFEGLRRAGDPAELAERYNAEGIDELVILDVTATIEGRRALEATIREVSSRLFIPLAVGGGIRAEADAAAAIDAGADKVSINSAALADPTLVTTLAERYGSQAVVVAIDAKQNGDRFDVFARSGKVPTNRDAVEWAVEAEARGAGEILLTSIDRDGTRAGFDCELTAAVSSAVSIPVIASGGAGHVRSLLRCLHGRQGGRRAGGIDLPLLRARGCGSEAVSRALVACRCVRSIGVLNDADSIDRSSRRANRSARAGRAPGRRDHRRRRLDRTLHRLSKGAAHRPRRGQERRRQRGAHRHDLRAAALPRRRRHPHARTRAGARRRSAPPASSSRLLSSKAAPSISSSPDVCPKRSRPTASSPPSTAAAVTSSSTAGGRCSTDPH